MTESAPRRLPTTPPPPALVPPSPRVRRRTPARDQRVRVTPADLVLLDRVVRYHAVTVPVLAHTVYGGKNRAGIYRRLARLVRVGLLEDLRTGDSNRGRPMDVFALYVATRPAYALIGSDLRSRPVNIHEVRHTLAVAEIGLALERFQHHVVTDRQIKRDLAVWKASRQSGQPMGALWLRDRAGRTHVPDLVVGPKDGAPATAIEVELTDKSEKTLRGILAMYADRTTFSRVIYYVPDAAAELRLNQIAADLHFGLGQLVVRRYVARHSRD
jgi:hypothetical protein